jgi:hypothetical protein
MVTFNNVSNGFKQNNKKFVKLQNVASSPEFNDFTKLVNTVEIDWNGATLDAADPASGGSYGPINDSAQLLELINTMQKEIYVLTAAVIALAGR